MSAPGQAVDLQLEQRWWVGWEFEYFAFCKERRCPRLIFEHTVTQAQGKNDRKWGNKPFIYKIFPLQGQCTCVCIVVTFGRWCFLSLIRARQCGVKRRGRVVRCEGTLCLSRQLWMEASTPSCCHCLSSHTCTLWVLFSPTNRRHGCLPFSKPSLYDCKASTVSQGNCLFSQQKKHSLAQCIIPCLLSVPACCCISASLGMPHVSLSKPVPDVPSPMGSSQSQVSSTIQHIANGIQCNPNIIQERYL